MSLRRIITSPYALIILFMLWLDWNAYMYNVITLGFRHKCIRIYFITMWSLETVLFIINSTFPVLQTGCARDRVLDLRKAPNCHGWELQRSDQPAGEDPAPPGLWVRGIFQLICPFLIILGRSLYTIISNVQDQTKKNSRNMKILFNQWN